jgi:FtsH-binding integral membrane protein
MELSSSRSLMVLRLSSAAAAALTLVQVVLVLLTVAKMGSLIEVHGIVGYLSLLATVIATVAAYVWFRKGGSRGLLMHAGGIVVLMVVQIGLGEMKAVWFHVGLGVLIVVGAIALATLAYRKPGGAA